jgi:hypothetical protein
MLNKLHYKGGISITSFINYVQIGQIFEFVRLVLFLKKYLRGCLAPSSQTEGSLLIPLAGFADQANDLSIAPIDLTNLKI